MRDVIVTLADASTETHVNASYLVYAGVLDIYDALGNKAATYADGQWHKVVWQPQAV